MTGKRSYDDGCPIALALDLLGERWSLLVVRELLLGPKRYSDLRRGLARIGPTVLSQRLDELADAGVVRRRRLPPPTSTHVYELTDWGSQLEETILSLGHWGSAMAAADSSPVRSGDSVILAMRARFDRAQSKHAFVCELRLGPDSFVLEMSPGTFNASRGLATDAHATITTDPDTISAVLWGGRRLADAEKAGVLRVEGDRTVVTSMQRVFPSAT